LNIRRPAMYELSAVGCELDGEVIISDLDPHLSKIGY